MKKYKTRLADLILQKKLASSGAVLIEGAKWCGKTTTASQVAKSILYMQNPASKKQNLEMAEINPSFLLVGDAPRLIDEWQLAPKLWDAVRFEVDQRDEFGQFILTGSAIPADTSEISHSGTGRISRMLMRPMSLFESGESNGSVSLYDLFSGNLKIAGVNTLDLAQIAFLICRGGWPKAITSTADVALQQAINYIDAIINFDISRVDDIQRDAEKTKRLLRSYARSIGMQTKISSITQDVYANETDSKEEITHKSITIGSYILTLKKNFDIEDSLAWHTPLTI